MAPLAGLCSGTAGYSDTPLKKEVIIIPPSSTACMPDFLTGTGQSHWLDYVEEFCMKRREFIMQAKKRSSKYYPKAASILMKYNLPSELKVLLTIESDCDPQVVSSAGAVGYWQFMDITGKEYGLTCVHQFTRAEKDKLKKEDPKKADSLIKTTLKKTDDRKNFNKSTLAAAKYLRDRYKNLEGDLLLVVASYNCGEGNVRKAMAKSEIPHASFWDIKDLLPKETQNYVMKFIALNVAFHNYELIANNTICFEKNAAIGEEQKLPVQTKSAGPVPGIR
jgi:membrane-bound lytic murein transglycosylase D